MAASANITMEDIKIWVESKKDENFRFNNIMPDGSPRERGVMENVFTQQFSIEEKIQSHLTEAEITDPFSKARETLLIISTMLDDPKSNSRAMIHLDEPAECLLIDVISLRNERFWCLTDETASSDPIIFVRFAHHELNVDNPDSAGKAIINKVERSKPFDGVHGHYNIPCSSKEEMAVLVRFFEENSKKISEKLKKKINKAAGSALLNIPGSKASFLTPLYLPLPDDGRKRKKGNCKVCGEPAGASCAKCKVARYCSVECQRGDWKTHKKECKTPESVAAETGACEGRAKGDSQDPWIDIDPRKLPDFLANKMNISLKTNVSIAHFGAMSTQVNPRDALVNVKPDKMHIVRVQFDLMQPMESFSGLIIDSQDSVIDVPFVLPQMMSGGEASYIKLYKMIQYQGLTAPHVGRPCKLYLDAYVTREGCLRVMLNKLHPMQPW